MNSLELVTQQRQKEQKFLKIFLISSLLGSLVFHVGAMTLKVGNFWSSVPPLAEEADEIEVTVTEADVPEESVKEELLTETPPEPEPPQELAFAPDISPPPIPLAPESQAPLTPGEDAPSKESSSPSNDPVSPMTNSAGDTPTTGSAIGPITSPNGQGSGFGNASRPTGFVPGGRPDGSPEGKPGGSPDGKPGGKPGGEGSTAVRTAPPTPVQVKPQQPVCVSCPKPKYQGKEASPRVEMNIRPDGSVEVRLRKTSGNPDLDRATLETMSKWRFDPKTVPQEGVRKRVRVTYEEEGSNFQRQNETRRQQEATQRQERDRQRLAEEERKQAEERNRVPTATTTESSPQSSPVAPRGSAEKPAPAPAGIIPTAEPPPVPVYEPPPAPVYEPPPEPTYEPPPEPVYEAPPVEAAPPETDNSGG
ncbi:MAG: energy transducer TonB [Leptolyngbyaceae cyanobacterium bins.302]|nr:energy transducer TonB [Leptolyngbyaceae cyanobacterium bins.302]